MKTLNLEEKPRTILGRPWMLIDFRVEQKPLELTYIEEATIGDLLELLVVNIPMQKCTMADAANAFDFIQTKRAAVNGLMDLSKTLEEWLKKLVEENAPKVFGVNAIIIKSLLDKVETKTVTK